MGNREEREKGSEKKDVDGMAGKKKNVSASHTEKKKPGDRSDRLA